MQGVALQCKKPRRKVNKFLILFSVVLKKDDLNDGQHLSSLNRCKKNTQFRREVFNFYEIITKNRKLWRKAVPLFLGSFINLLRTSGEFNE